MPTIFVLEDQRAGLPSVATALREHGFCVLPLDRADELTEAMGCVRADLIVVDGRADRDRAAPLHAALRAEGHGLGSPVPILVVRADAIEDSSIRDAVPSFVDDGEEGVTRTLLEHVRRHIEPLTVPYN